MNKVENRGKKLHQLAKLVYALHEQSNATSATSRLASFEPLGDVAFPMAFLWFVRGFAAKLTKISEIVSQTAAIKVQSIYEI